jgi:hypothetical protein
MHALTQIIEGFQAVPNVAICYLVQRLAFNVLQKSFHVAFVKLRGCSTQFKVYSTENLKLDPRPIKLT